MRAEMLGIKLHPATVNRWSLYIVHLNLHFENNEPTVDSIYENEWSSRFSFFQIVEGFLYHFSQRTQE